jgi:hypothetical protein
MLHMVRPRHRVFAVGGRELDLDMSQLLDKMRNVEPEPIRDHLVEVGNTEFPRSKCWRVLPGGTS